eukprot:TRINITY_DN8064_c0_g1_i7.p3 TRINITY_DN8064_c0_g1~~TRINITY_DN8064_c0_g1_i7.p3  ORF type:complete len:120 (-),score=2.40 TRINITY_DN8064_c0_g1_i7:168-527(-)
MYKELESLLRWAQQVKNVIQQFVKIKKQRGWEVVIRKYQLNNNTVVVEPQVIYGLGIIHYRSSKESIKGNTLGPFLFSQALRTCLQKFYWQILNIKFKAWYLDNGCFFVQDNNYIIFHK